MDSHGEVAARIITILTLNGHLESDSIADAAMVPAKDSREVRSICIIFYGFQLPLILFCFAFADMGFPPVFFTATINVTSFKILHRLYRSRYIDLFTLNTSRQHNPSNMIYLWNVDHARILRNVTDDVCRAILNLRLRRQHEIEMGRNWIERAQEGEVDENDHEADKLNHQKFCLGLERLYNATLQLDETLMVLKDFSR